MAKYVFVTGGVISSVGKGITAGVDRPADQEPRRQRLDP